MLYYTGASHTGRVCYDRRSADGSTIGCLRFSYGSILILQVSLELYPTEGRPPSRKSRRRLAGMMFMLKKETAEAMKAL
jgi:hypothetical protein